MANTKFQLKRSVVPGKIPLSTDLEIGELAINLTDTKIFSKHSLGNIVTLSDFELSNSAYNISIASYDASNNATFVNNTQNTNIELAFNQANNSLSISQSAFDNSNSAISNTISIFGAISSQNNVILNIQGVDETQNTNINSAFSKANVANIIAELAYDAANTALTTGLITYIQSDEYMASANQVSFNTTISYDAGHLFVYRNGILLEKSEYSANGGTLVTLNSGVPENDIIVLQYSGGAITNTSSLWLPANAAYNLVFSAYSTANAAYATTNSIISGDVVIKKINLPEANISSNTIVTSTNSANQVMDLFSTSEFRSLKYMIQVSSGTDFQFSEIFLIHNDSISYITENGLITTNGSLMTYNSDISGGNVRLLMSPVNNINTIKILRTSITI